MDQPGRLTLTRNETWTKSLPVDFQGYVGNLGYDGDGFIGVIGGGVCGGDREF